MNQDGTVHEMEKVDRIEQFFTADDLVGTDIGKKDLVAEKLQRRQGLIALLTLKGFFMLLKIINLEVVDHNVQSKTAFVK